MDDLSFTCYPDDNFMVCANNDRAVAWLNNNVAHTPDDDGPEEGLWVNAWVTQEEFLRVFEKARADGLQVGDIGFELDLTDTQYRGAQQHARERGISVEEAVKETILVGMESAEQAQKLIDEFLKRRAEDKGKRK
jgi:hypothetical protein